MRHIGSLADQPAARRFQSWLASKGIAANIELEDDRWSVWVHDEDLIELARDELATFLADSQAEKYQLVEAAAELERRAKPVASEQTRRSTRTPGQPWTMTPWRSCPATITLIGLSILLTALCVRGFDRDRGPLEFQMAYEPVMNHLTIVTITERDDGVYVPTYNLSKAWQHLRESLAEDYEFQLPETGVGAIVRGQFWRLVTPIFLHFSILHILFNMLWLRMLGGEIESRRGLLRYVGLVLLIAAVSNLGQYAATGSPLFGGMSGVVYGVFGYLWMKQRQDPDAGLSLPPNCIFWMLGWFVVCWTGMVGGIANWSHTFGLVSGMLVGLLPSRR
jgi:GlpG protein